MFQGNWISNKLKSSLLLLIIVACSSPKQPLPVYGPKQINESGEEIDYTVSDFKFVNQNNQIITLDKYKNQVYVTDFFFTTCQTIFSKPLAQHVKSTLPQLFCQLTIGW